MILNQYYELYRRELEESVVPFWLKYSLDREFGGYFSGLERDGTVYDDRKYIWLQGRCVWMFSRLYNEWDCRPEYLDAARLGADFIRKYGRDGEGRYFFGLTRDGRPLHFQRKPYGAVFVMMGLLEYGKASQNTDCIAEAVALFWRIVDWIRDPTLLCQPPRPQGSPEASTLADEMVLMSMAMELLRVKKDARVRQVLENAFRRAFLHYDPNHRILMELAAVDNTPLNSLPEGRLFNPGHSIEVAWLLLHAMDFVPHTDAEREKAFAIIDGSLEKGWDTEYGGLYYLMDIEGKPLLQLEHTMKLWWPLTEALYALVLAYCRTRDKQWLAWLEKVHNYTFARCPDPEFGEWFGYFDRQGNLTHTCKGGNYKGFFHIARALLMCLQRMKEEK